MKMTVAYPMCLCPCGKPVKGCGKEQLVLSWSAFHGFEASVGWNLLTVYHVMCVYHQAHGQIGWFSLEYLLQPMPPPDSCTTWLRREYPALMQQLECLCQPEAVCDTR